MSLCYYNTSIKCKGDYKDCTDCVLDKIKAEIADLADEPTYGDYQYGFSHGLMRAAQIIDEYKAESEDGE